MRILVLGATGRTGQKVVQQALHRGHSVTAVVRRPSLSETTELRVVLADPRDPKQMLQAVTEHDAVVCCLGQRGSSAPRLVSDAAAATLDAMRKVGLKRFVIVSGALLYPSRNPVALLLKRMMSEKLADARVAEQIVCDSEAEWTIVRPPHLREGMAKGYRTDIGPHPALTCGLQFEDLASCLVDLAESDALLHRTVRVASR